jgi:hypothetical protein
LPSNEAEVGCGSDYSLGGRRTNQLYKSLKLLNYDYLQGASEAR